MGSKCREIGINVDPLIDALRASPEYPAIEKLENEAKVLLQLAMANSFTRIFYITMAQRKHEIAALKRKRILDGLSSY